MEYFKSSFDNILNYFTSLENYQLYCLNLSPVVKRYFELIATKQSFVSSCYYLSFL